MHTQNLTIPLDITTKIPDSILFVSETIQIPQNNAKFIAVNHNKNDPMFKATREGLVTENQNLFTQNDIKIQPAVVSINKGNTFILVQNIYIYWKAKFSLKSKFPLNIFRCENLIFADGPLSRI